MNIVDRVAGLSHFLPYLDRYRIHVEEACLLPTAAFPTVNTDSIQQLGLR
jgi:hypothetical protein